MDTWTFGHTWNPSLGHEQPISSSTAKSLNPPSLEICFSSHSTFWMITLLILICFSGAASQHKAEQLCLSEELCPQQMPTGILSALRKHIITSSALSGGVQNQNMLLFPAQDDQMPEFILLITWQFTLNSVYKRS